MVPTGFSLSCCVLAVLAESRLPKNLYAGLGPVDGIPKQQVLVFRTKGG